MNKYVRKNNIAIAGGSCTGKSTLAAALFAVLKFRDFDYDLVTEESRHLRREMGSFRSPFERFYMWRQQEREELRSTAAHGFITDAPLFNFYIGALMHVAEPRDHLAVRELFRMCLECRDRYQLVVIAKDCREIPYRRDHARRASQMTSVQKHRLTTSFVEHFMPEKLLYVHGTPAQRASQVIRRLEVAIHEGRSDKGNRQ